MKSPPGWEQAPASDRDRRRRGPRRRAGPRLKEALIAEAAQAAFGYLDQLLAEFDTAAHGDHDTARDTLLDVYLSTQHRDQPGTGCPTAGFAILLARATAGTELSEKILECTHEVLTAPRGS